MHMRIVVLAVSVLLAFGERGQGCSICDPNFQQKPTLRQSARLAKFVVIGTLSNPRLDGEKGLTDFTIEHIVQNDASLGKQKVLTIPGYIPVDPKKPPRYLLFGDIINGRLDILQSRLVRGTDAVDYLKSSLKIDDRDRVAVLQFCFKHIDAADADVSSDAFHELAKASDQEVAQLAKKLSPEKFRKLMKDPNTPADRLSIYAFLLGACGNKDDANLLIALIRKNDERGNAALSGLLGGLIELRPEQGWAMVQQILRDPKRPFSDKFSALGTLRFYHACKPTESRKEIALSLSAVVEFGDMADMAIEDLRRWQWWELTKTVLAQYAKPTHVAPLVRRSIIRYALCCPEAEAGEFVKARRLAEPDVVKQVEQALEFEKPIPPKKTP